MRVCDESSLVPRLPTSFAIHSRFPVSTCGLIGQSSAINRYGRTAVAKPNFQWRKRTRISPDQPGSPAELGQVSIPRHFRRRCTAWGLPVERGAAPISCSGAGSRRRGHLNVTLVLTSRVYGGGGPFMIACALRYISQEVAESIGVLVVVQARIGSIGEVMTVRPVSVSAAQCTVHVVNGVGAWTLRRSWTVSSLSIGIHCSPEF